MSAATLIFEIALTRVFAVAQGYHFAFMTVSLALLGSAASGSFLSLMQGRARAHLHRWLTTTAALSWFTIIGGYLVANYLPFDMYRVAWERSQLLYLALYYLALAAPFFFMGLGVSLLLTTQARRVNLVYFVNLAGSAAGCILVLAFLPLFGGAGTILCAALFAALAVILFSSTAPRRAFAISTLLISILLITLRPAFLEIRMSPYKSLSNLLRYPDARLLSTRWNAFSRVDVIRSSSIRSAPGLSLASPQQPPFQLGVTIDGDDLSPITGREKLDFLDYLPTALAYQLVSRPRALVINPRGGLDVLAALHHNAAEITVVEDNRLVARAVETYGDDLYADERVRVVHESPRTYARRVLAFADSAMGIAPWRSGTENAMRTALQTVEPFEIVQLSLSESFKPTTLGAYSLGEDYRYTVEAFRDFYRLLAPNGYLVISRWLQQPPAEETRALATVITALDKLGAEPRDQIIALRSFQTMVILVKNGIITPADVAALREFCATRQFDLVYYSGIAPDEVNRRFVLEQPYYYDAARSLLSPTLRERFYKRSIYDLRPATDDHPFFFHFFKWRQTPRILRDFGKTWQPFGGSGYLILVALLIIALLAAAVFILLPLRWLQRRTNYTTGKESVLLYFFALGIGYLFIEIPLMQRFILFLGQPTYSFAVVLGAILLFSGIGSLLSPRFPLRVILVILIGVVVLYPLLLPKVFNMFLGNSFPVRFLVTLILLAPLGTLMGMPFPHGITRVNHNAPDLVPWVWGINGAASVISSILATMLAVSFSFSVVLILGGVAYAVAYVNSDIH